MSEHVPTPVSVDDAWASTVFFPERTPTSMRTDCFAVVTEYRDGGVFLANYADGLSDLDLDAYVDAFVAEDLTACFLAVPAPHTFHIVHTDDDDRVTGLEHVAESKVRINGGFFVLRQEIYDAMEPGDELVLEPFGRLMAQNRLVARPFDGFWQNMDTFKDKIRMDELAAGGAPPWKLWD